LLDAASGAGRELAQVVLILADDAADLRVAVVEHVVQQEHRALFKGEAFEEYQHRDRKRVGHLRLLCRVFELVGDDRHGQPLAHIPLAARACRPQLVDGQARGDGCHERSG
jgi:hypothetical protein